MFSKRLIQPELLDHAEPDEARENLADLVRINASLGGYSVLRKLLKDIWAPDDRLRVLDVGAASGDVGRLIQGVYPGVVVTSLDANAVNLAAASRPKLLADAFALPFDCDSFDYVIASLFLHHFDDERVVRLLREFSRVARRAVLICDLERHILPYLFLPATRFFFGWGRLTVHDGPISVRASFRAAELADLARLAGLSLVKVRVHRPAFRLTMIVSKDPGANRPKP